MQLVILHDGHLAEIKCHIHNWHNIPAKQWHFNGNLEKPTFSPSIRELKEDGKTTRCHYSIADGVIEYHDNDQGKHQGEKLPMLPFTEAEVACANWVTRQEETRKEG